MIIKSISNYNEIILAMRQIVSTQSELPLDYILNAETHQGAALQHVVNTYDENEHLIDSKLVPFDTSETFIVFCLTEEPEKSKTQIQSDNSIDCFAFLVMNFIIYGDDAMTVAQKLLARMTTQKVRTSLEANGIHIESINPVNSMNEFINEIYWQRKELEIRLSVRYNFKQVSDDNSMLMVKPINVEVNEEFARVQGRTLILERQADVNNRTLEIDADVDTEGNLIILS